MHLNVALYVLHCLVKVVKNVQVFYYLLCLKAFVYFKGIENAIYVCVCIYIYIYIYILNHIKLFMSLNTSKIVYYSYFNAIISYGLSSWGNSPPSYENI